MNMNTHESNSHENGNGANHNGAAPKGKIDWLDLKFIESTANEFYQAPPQPTTPQIPSLPLSPLANDLPPLNLGNLGNLPSPSPSSSSYYFISSPQEAVLTYPQQKVGPDVPTDVTGGRVTTPEPYIPTDVTGGRVTTPEPYIPTDVTGGRVATPEPYIPTDVTGGQIPTVTLYDPTGLGGGQVPPAPTVDHRIPTGVEGGYIPTVTLYDPTGLGGGQVPPAPTVEDDIPTDVEGEKVSQTPTVDSIQEINLGARDGFEVNRIRRDFPLLHQQVNGHPLIWFDNGATTQKPQQVIDRVSRFYERDNSNIHRGAHTLAARSTDAYEGSREKVQRFLGAGSKDEIIFVRGTTEAINLVAQTYGRQYLQPGDEIVLTILEHHANIVPWQMVAKERGAVIKVVPVNDRGEILLEEYGKLLGPRTKLVGLTQVSNAIGTILPAQEMTSMAHRVGARVLIDGAQAVSHFPVNVQSLDCDFYAFSGHKLFAPTGIGVLYAKRECLEMLPPWQGGGSMIRDVTFEQTVYSDPPAKFEAGTPSIADAVGLGAAIDYLNRVGLVNIERYERDLTEYGIEVLSSVPGLRLIGTAPHKVGVLSFVMEQMSTEEVGKRLDREGIAVRAGHHCAQPTVRRFGLEGTVRPSLAFYNTREELDTLGDVLRRLPYL